MNCTACGLQLPVGQAFCTRCGTPAQAQLPAQAPAPTPTLAQPPTQATAAAPSRFCTSCGNPLPDAVRFCTACGAPKSGTAATHVEPTALPAMPAEHMPAYLEAADIVGARYDPLAEQLFTAAAQAMGGVVSFEQQYNRWTTHLEFPDGRSQRVFLYVEEPNPRASTYLGAGHVLVTVASSAGPDTGIVDHWMIFRRAAQLYFTRVVSDAAPWGATLRVRGSLLLSTATPGLIAGMINEAGAEADVLEESIFGSAVDDD